MPVMMFVMIAGPLTDHYGRKPLILSALVGYLILNLVFLVNSLWFYQLKVGGFKFQLYSSPSGKRMMMRFSKSALKDSFNMTSNEILFVTLIFTAFISKVRVQTLLEKYQMNPSQTK